MDQLRPLQVTRVSEKGTQKTDASSSLIQDVGSTRAKRDAPESRRPTMPEDCYHILRDQPDYESLTSTLLFLSWPPKDPDAFALWKPTPVGGQIIHALVTETAPNYWANMKEDADVGQDSCINLFVSCVRCVAGINCILTRLKALIQEAKSERQAKGPPSYLELETMLDLLGRVLLGDSVVLDMWRDVATGGLDKPKVKPLTDGMLSLFGGGTIISVTAEATELLKDKSNTLWFSRIPDYTEWLARNVARGQLESPTPAQAKFFSQLFERGSHLGDFSKITRTVFSRLLLEQPTDQKRFAVLMDGLQQKEQRRVLFGVLQILSTDQLHRLGNCTSPESPVMVSAVAAAVDLIVNGVSLRVDHLVQWLTAPSGAGAADGVGIRRAVVAALSKDMGSMAKVLESSTRQFADKLYLGFTPIIQQEAHAQVILLSAGYVARSYKMKLRSVTKSAVYLNMISNRIAALTARARFLGMVVGEAISALIDDKSLDFKNEETNSPEGLWYKGLTGVSDAIGPIEPLIRTSQKPPSTLESSRTTRKDPKVVNAPRKQNQTTPKPVVAHRGNPAAIGIQVIEEVSDDDLGDDVAPYEKPDSDAEDSEEDATMVRRDKLTSPVYIRNLIAYFRKTDSYDHQKLALTTAPTLIRRKANYGSEMADHSDEAASLLAGLQNTYDMEDFDDLRLQGMISLVVATPQTMGEWFAKTFFDGDYSVAQRASILATLGLAAREIAGLDESKYAAGSSFASKALPEHVEKLYLDQNSAQALPSTSSLKPIAPNALEQMARSVTSDILAPLAAAAADAATGPDALKLTTFTSRLTKSNKSKATATHRNPPKPASVTKAATQTLSKSLFYPLTARFQSALYSSKQRSKMFVFQPYLLGLLLKTLGLIFHATGPFTLEVHQMTSELWTLAMSPPVLKQAAGDLTLRNSVLFALLAILDVNVDRMRDVCREMGKEVVETREWAAAVYGGTVGGDRGEEDETKSLAAAVLVRLSEAMEEFRLAMVGDLVGFE